MDSEEGGGAAGDEDAGLVDGVVGGVEGAVVRERGLWEGEQEGRRDALVDGVFGYVDEEEWEHEWEEEGAGAVEVVPEVREGEAVGMVGCCCWVLIGGGGEEASVFCVGLFVIVGQVVVENFGGLLFLARCGWC